jgi:tRNA(Ile2) C34 agmatinyltransferase TiaS
MEKIKIKKRIISLEVLDNVYLKRICPKCQSDNVSNGKKHRCRDCGKTGKLFPMKQATGYEIDKWITRKG